MFAAAGIVVGCGLLVGVVVETAMAVVLNPCAKLKRPRHANHLNKTGLLKAKQWESITRRGDKHTCFAVHQGKGRNRKLYSLQKWYANY